MKTETNKTKTDDEEDEEGKGGIKAATVEKLVQRVTPEVDFFFILLLPPFFFFGNLLKRG